MATIIPGMNPIDFSDVYDVLLLDEVNVSPGQLVALTGAKRETGWDVKDGTGQSGASITRKGDKLVKFSAKFYLVKDAALGIDDFADWVTFLPLLKSCTAGKDPKSLSIYHPDLALIDVDAVVVESIGALEHDGKGGAFVTVSFIEYRPPKKAGGSPTKKKDPNADVKAELDALVNEAKKP